MNDTKITLYRMVNNKVRYYTLAVYNTLFGEYMFIRENGSVKNKKPTRVIKEYYKSVSEAMGVLKIKLQERYKRGYVHKQKELEPGQGGE